MLDIIDLLTKNLAKRCKEQLDLRLSFTNEAKEFLVKKYADAKMGARPLKRGIQSAVEDELAEEILKGNIKRGDDVTVMVNDEMIKFTVKKD